jgi:uncharacterized protein (TIGR03083 family)
MNAHEEVAALLGVWAVGACSAEEADAVMDHLPHCDDCAAESVRLRDAADLLGLAAQPPARLRERTLNRARELRAPAPICPAYAEPYAAQVSVLDSLLADLSERQWSAHVVYDWSVQDVVAHLAATDGLVAARLGVDVDPPAPSVGVVDGPAVERRTAAVIDRERSRAPAFTRAAWRAQADALCRGLPAEPGQRVSGIRTRIADTVVARAFETWVHTDDIAKAVGRDLPPPLAHHVRQIAELGVRSLSKALALNGAERPGDAARIVLDGPGGGDWTVRLGRDASGGAPAVRLDMDVLEFCFLAGGRRDPATVTVTVTGDESLGRELLVAAPAFSGP